MPARTSSASTILLVIFLIITFPIWIGLAGGLFGLVFGLFGAAIGVMAGIFGAIIGLIGSIIGAVFGVFNWWSWPFSFHVPSFNLWAAVAIVLFVVLLTRSKRRVF
jgi:hypothetical protein